MNSSITVDNRSAVSLTGVKSVESVTNTAVVVFTDDGDLVIRGSSLGAEEFDPESGILRIFGRIDSLSYTTDKRHLADNVIAKLFR